jgi:hypothetical protein
VARRRLGDRVIVVRVGEPGPGTNQSGEATTELGAKAVQVVAAQLVYRDEDDE